MSEADLWTPTPGPTLRNYVDNLGYLSEDGRDEFFSNTAKILGRCSSPNSTYSQKCVLVAGEIQSGKTASFTGVCALARDNGYPLIIVLAGTKVSLLTQTVDRLCEDLKVDAAGSLPEWLVVKTPAKKSYASIKESLETWKDPNWPMQYRRAVIVAVTKTPASIKKMQSLVERLVGEGVSVPALIIDDEADQAGLNLRADQDDQSPTYEAILNLRNALFSHSLISYTATPQANLLVQLEDELSPDSVVVLDSGSTYVGGEDLFAPGGTFYRSIPANEISNATNPVATDAPPATLKKALAYFFVALTIAQERTPGTKPLSMLVHPASKKDVHGKYEMWIKGIFDHWELLMVEDDGFRELQKLEFGSAMDEVERTVKIDEVFPNSQDPRSRILELVKFWIRKVELRVINSVPGGQDIRPADWDSKPGWIVIGGNKLERGFTIKNLAVTYMPRGTGINAVDTIQQRARFFGHKRGYLDLLRGWINEDTRESLTLDVETEKALREELIRLDKLALPLKEWKRKIVLGANMIPTRNAVVTLDVNRINLKAGWRFEQNCLFDPVLPNIYDNAFGLISSWFSRSDVYERDTRSLESSDLHHVSQVPAIDLIDILADWPMHENDRKHLDSLIPAIRNYALLQNHLDTHLIFMDNMRTRQRSRIKGQAPAEVRDWKINNLHAGRSGTYPGDQLIRTNDAITVQVHKVQPRTSPDDDASNEAVLALALAWPAGFQRSIIIQN